MVYVARAEYSELGAFGPNVFMDITLCCNVATGWEGCLAIGGPLGPIYGQNRQRTASDMLVESHRKQSSNGLQHPGDMESADEVSRLVASESTRNPAQAGVGSQTQREVQAEDAWFAERASHPHSSSTLPKEGVANPQTLGKRAPCATVEEHRTKRRRVESPGNLE